MLVARRPPHRPVVNNYLSCMGPSPTVLLWSQGGCVESLSRARPHLGRPGPVPKAEMCPRPRKPHFQHQNICWGDPGALMGLLVPPRHPSPTPALGCHCKARLPFWTGPSAGATCAHCCWRVLNVWADIQIVYGLFMEIKPCCSLWIPVPCRPKNPTGVFWLNGRGQVLGAPRGGAIKLSLCCRTCLK